jgi:hypothetical protein
MYSRHESTHDTEASRPVVYICVTLFGFSTPAPSSKGYRRGLPDHTTSLPQAEYATDYAKKKKQKRKRKFD